MEAGVIAQMPHIYGVQAEACAPLYYAYQGRAAPPPQPTVAEGISIANPIHRQAIVEAVRATEGDILMMDEEETLHACRYLARRGLYVEPTSAVAVAALPQIKDRLSPGETVLSLTGSGLKWGGQDEP
jgi:threonine synthase